MRLHHLEVTAFGPFPDTVRVDFDRLSGAGLFLLTGPTGAGKSSVLDAVCFALYGDVPGDRASAKRLRCDQAGEGVAPRVVLEVTLAGRRYRIERSPAWTRPKRRGTGTTTEQARVVLCERIDGEWVPLSTRLDEAGHLVSHRVGLTLAQFCQVAMLPQGRFQAFLRARSEERHALLQQVFRTGRFDQVEKWLRERRVTLRRTSAGHEERVADLVSRVSEVSSTPAPEDWQEAPASLLAWTAELRSGTERDAAGAWQQSLASGHSLTAAQAAADRGARLARAQRQHADAVDELARLHARSDEVSAAEAGLDAARRAEGVGALAGLAEDAVRREATAAAGLRRALAGASAALGRPIDPDHLGELRRATLDELSDVARVRPVLARQREARAELDALTAAVAALDAGLARVAERADELPAELAGVRAELVEVEVAGTRAGELVSRLADLEERSAARRTAAELARDLALADADRVATVTELQTAKETWLDLREQRLDGMAAEIATGLVVGGCCPVCGSAEHPSPAAARAGAPDAAAERAARRRVDDLEVTAEARAQHVRDLDTRLAAARARAGDDAAGLDALLATMRQELAAARAAAARADGARGRLAALEVEQRMVTAEAERLRADLLARQERRGRVETLHDELDAQVRAVLARREDLTEDADGGSAGDTVDLDALETRLATLDAACARAEAALDEHARAEHALAEAVTAADLAAVAAGFDTRADATAAVLDDAGRAALEELVADHRRALDRVHHALDDPEVRVSVEVAAPDLPELESALDTARQADARARRAHEAVQERGRRLARLGEDLAAAVTGWQPVRDELEVTAGLASFVEGRSPDNRLQMRLSAYVLAHRLAQVVAAANLRLAAMSDQRFSLVHTGQRGAGESRGGLSLLVRDDWSGESRDPATLSGGETFVVSLALALGLADVIAGEAGGADLDTLFVDEGFGSLDADTLDDVMDTLDSLRDGGRVVGVVSHVPELQTRIPTQLRVHKARHGSRTSLRLG